MAIFYMSVDRLLVNGQPRGNLAAFDLTTGALLAWNPNLNSTGTSIFATANAVYISGMFSQVGGAPQQYLVAVDPSSGANLGTISGYTDYVFYEALNVINNKLYVGGKAVVDLTTGNITSGFNSSIFKILPLGSKFFVSGYFFSANRKPRVALAAFDTQTGALLDWAPARPTDIPYYPTARRLRVVGNKVYVGYYILTQNYSYVEVFDINGNRDPDFNTVVLSGGKLFDMEVDSENNRIYLGGSFTMVNGQNRTRASR